MGNKVTIEFNRTTEAGPLPPITVTLTAQIDKGWRSAIWKKAVIEVRNKQWKGEKVMEALETAINQMGRERYEKLLFVVEMVLYEKWGRDSYLLLFRDFASESIDPFWKCDPINVSTEKRVPYSKYWFYWELDIETIQRREKHNQTVTESFFGNSQQRTNYSFIHEVLNTQNVVISIFYFWYKATGFGHPARSEILIYSLYY